jgi:hypothetical protein
MPRTTSTTARIGRRSTSGPYASATPNSTPAASDSATDSTETSNVTCNPRNSEGAACSMTCSAFIGS